MLEINFYERMKRSLSGIRLDVVEETALSVVLNPFHKCCEVFVLDNIVNFSGTVGIR